MGRPRPGCISADGGTVNIVHVESGNVVADRAARATSHWQRFRGLMLRSGLQPGEALVIEPCGSIHMMFMRFRIDAVFYDKDGRVTKVARGVRPWIGLAFGGRGAKGVIEMRPGDAIGLQPGDELRMSAEL